MYKRGTGNSPLWPWGSGRQFLEVESWRSGQIPQSCLLHRRLLPSWRRRPVSCFKASHWHLCFLGSSLWWDNPMEKDAFALAPPSLSVFLKDLLTITMKKPERDWQVIYMGHFKGLRDLELPKSHVFSFWDSCSVASGINVFSQLLADWPCKAQWMPMSLVICASSYLQDTHALESYGTGCWHSQTGPVAVGKPKMITWMQMPYLLLPQVSAVVKRFLLWKKGHFSAFDLILSDLGLVSQMEL